MSDRVNLSLKISLQVLSWHVCGPELSIGFNLSISSSHSLFLFSNSCFLCFLCFCFSLFLCLESLLHCLFVLLFGNLSSLNSWVLWDVFQFSFSCLNEIFFLLLFFLNLGQVSFECWKIWFLLLFNLFHFGWISLYFFRINQVGKFISNSNKWICLLSLLCFNICKLFLKIFDFLRALSCWFSNFLCSSNSQFGKVCMQSWDEFIFKESFFGILFNSCFFFFNLQLSKGLFGILKFLRVLNFFAFNFKALDLFIKFFFFFFLS